MEKTARCQCGKLSAVASGDAQMIGVCHCEDCQRRTGSVFGAGAYFRKEQVRLEGARTVFAQKGSFVREKRFSFCPMCGTTVYWELDAFPDLCSVAVGAFADPTFGGPSVSWWERSAHDWVRLPEGTKHHETQ
jgi:hypothetical protein